MPAAFALAALLLMSGAFHNLRADTKKIAPPADAAILKIFAAHHDDFANLRKMVIEDLHSHKMSVFNESTVSKLTSAERVSAYKRLLAVSPRLTVGVNYDESVRFIFAAEGETVGPGWSKGMQFVPSGAQVVGEEKSNLDTRPKEPGVYLRKIESQWWMFYQVDD